MNSFPQSKHFFFFGLGVISIIFVKGNKGYYLFR